MADGRMTVLSVIYTPVYSGPQNRMSIVAKLLEPQGIDVVVVLPDEGQAAAQRLRDNGVTVQTMPLHRLRSRPDPRVHVEYVKTLRREVAVMAELIGDLGVDVVASNTFPNLHGPLAARKADVACVWQLIDTFTPPPVRALFMPFVWRLSDVVMTTGIKVGEMHPGVRRFGLNDRWLSFFPCVDVDKFSADAATRATAREELGLPADATVIGNVAAMSPMKGHRYFVRAAAQVRATHPHTRFVILGSTHADREDYYRDLWAEAESLGLKLGHDLIVHDPGPRVSALAQAFDMFWMTSEPCSEGVPTAIGEAKALGLPVVTTDVGSTSECVTEGVSGYVVPPRDPGAIATAARRILDDPALRLSMGVQARTEAVQQYASERGAEQHRIAFERAIAHHAAKKRR